MFNSNCASVPLVANIDGNGNGNNGWGDGSWLWFIIVIFAIFGGCGNGFGWVGNNGRDGYPCATQADVRAAVDQQTLISKLDQQTYGLSSTFTALNDNLNSNFRGIDNAICTLGYQNQQGFNTLGFQNQQCCCETQRLIERGFADTNYNIATQANAVQNAIQNGFCQTNYNAATNTRDIIDAQRASTEAIINKLCNMENNAKDERIATLTAQLNKADIANMINANGAYVVNQINPQASPAYIVPNPNCCYGYQQTNACGCC